MNNIKNYKKCLYISFLVLVLNLIQFSTNNIQASVYKINYIEVSEPYDADFDKSKVVDKAFILAFKELIQKTTKSENISILLKTRIREIKKLVDSFEIINENFVDNKYSAKFNVFFDKKKFLKFFELHNVFSSIPLNKKIFFLPVVIDLTKNQISLFSENKFYLLWNKEKKKHYLIEYILPNEDLDDLVIIKKNFNNIEDYDFKEIQSKYDLVDFIILIVFNDKKKIKTLSKINLNNKLFISRNEFESDNGIELDNVINKLKKDYEDHWKSLNIINSSIKLNIKVSIDSKKTKLANNFEENLRKLDLVPHFKIDKFSNNKIIYKIIYNGTPDKFLSELKLKGFQINKSKEIWYIE